MRKLDLVQFAVVLTLLLQVTFVESDGYFYVGLLAYNNTEGVRCCGNQIEESNCLDECGLIFQIHVSGLNGTEHSKNLSHKKLTLAESMTIPSSRVTNPLSFHFNGWSGRVNVTVVITASYKDNVYEQFDLFQQTFESLTPTNFYYSNQVDSDVVGDLSRLTIVFRYRCNPLDGPDCFGDCLEHDPSETCPPPPPTPTSEIYTGFTDPLCDLTGNCTDNNTTPSTRPTTKFIVTTTSPEETNETTNEVSASSNEVKDFSTAKHTDTTTKSVYQDSAVLQNSTTTGSSETSTFDSRDIFTNVSQDSLTTSTTQYWVSDTPEETTVKLGSELGKTKTKTNITSSTNSLNRLSNALTSKSSVRITDFQSKLSSAVTTGSPTTPDEISTKIDDNPAYWPAIVGGILGGIAVMSAIGFCIYYRRQKKLRKRQEIYNVNPKLLRNFEEYDENGTSGRADVPLETEQY